MSDHQDEIQQFIDEAHFWAKGLLKRGACPSCLAQAMIGEGFNLADTVGVLDLANETADRYADGVGGPVLNQH